LLSNARLTTPIANSSPVSLSSFGVGRARERGAIALPHLDERVDQREADACIVARRQRRAADFRCERLTLRRIAKHDQRKRRVEQRRAAAIHRQRLADRPARPVGVAHRRRNLRDVAPLRGRRPLQAGLRGRLGLEPPAELDRARELPLIAGDADLGADHAVRVGKTLPGLELPRHTGLVVPEEREHIELRSDADRIEPARHRLLERRSRLVHLAETQIHVGEVAAWQRLVGRQRNRRLEFDDGLLELAEALIGAAEIRVRDVVVGIGLVPDLIRLDRFLRRQLRGRVIACGDVEAFGLAHAILQRERPGDVRAGFFFFAEVAEHRAQARVGQRELGILFDGLAQKRQRRLVAVTPPRRHPGAVRLERFERGGGRVVDRRVVLADRGQGLAETAAQIVGRGRPAP
jgi:hypothetical protein